jgi:serine/threonine protein kinase
MWHTGRALIRAARHPEVFYPPVHVQSFPQVFYGHWRGQPVAVKVLLNQQHSAPLGLPGQPVAVAAPAALAPHYAGHAAAAAPLPVEAKLLLEFRREVSTMLRLPEHPNVLRLVAVCSVPPLAVVTEFCEGGSLFGLLHCPTAQLSWVQVGWAALGWAATDAGLRVAFLIASSGVRDQGSCVVGAHAVVRRSCRSPLTKVARILREAAMGMAHLHRNSVLHRWGDWHARVGVHAYLVPAVLVCDARLSGIARARPT